MNAVKYLKIKIRMTKGCIRSDNCFQCVLSSENNPYKVHCETFELQHPEEAVAAVEKWAKEHLHETRMGDFLKKFPKATVLKCADDEYIDICPTYINNTRTCPKGECKRCKIEYWNEEAEE